MEGLHYLTMKGKQSGGALQDPVRREVQPAALGEACAWGGRSVAWRRSPRCGHLCQVFSSRRAVPSACLSWTRSQHAQGQSPAGGGTGQPPQTRAAQLSGLAVAPRQVAGAVEAPVKTHLRGHAVSAGLPRHPPHSWSPLPLLPMAWCLSRISSPTDTCPPTSTRLHLL